MSWRKLVPLALVAILAAPAFAALVPVAAAQETVPVAQGVVWKNQANHLQRLWLRFGDLDDPSPIDPGQGRADCSGTAGRTPYLSFSRASTDTAAQREPCAFPAGVGTEPTGPGVVTFTYGSALLHSFNVSGNNSLRYVHAGNVPPDVTMTVRVLNGNNLVGAASWTGRDNPADGRDYDISIPLGPTSRAEFKRGEDIKVLLSGRTTATQGILPDTAPVWTIDDTASRLELRAEDALKAATWTQDESSNVVSLFRPLDATRPSDKRIVGFFAIQSAFGLGDARGGDEPRFTLERGGRAEPLGPNGDTFLTGGYNVSASSDAEGRAVWNFPSGHLDYRGLAAGEYNLTVDKPYHQEGAFRYGIVHRILVTAQSVTLEPYDDADPATSPQPLESLAHETSAGGTTTYVFLVNNTGSVNDTFRLDATFVSGTPSGWSASVGGPGVVDRTVALRPQESRVVTLTVTAPAGAPVGSSSIFQLSATSLVDPQARTSPITAITTISNAVRHEVGVITPGRTIGIEPGIETRLPVHVWNRGTRVANVSLEIQETPLAGWSARIAQGDGGTSRIVIPNVRPGDIVPVDLLVNAPISQPDALHDITLNVTHQDVGGVSADRVLTLVARPTASVRLDLFQEVAGLGHYVEVTGSISRDPATGAPVPDPRCGPDPSRGLGCYEDGVDGAWFRLWITNTGKRTDTFELRMDSFAAASTFGCSSTVFDPHGRTDGQLDFYYRDREGGFVQRSSVVLAPGQTGELYVWRSADRYENPCPDSDRGVDFHRFVVEARGLETGAVARRLAETIAEDGAYRTAVYLEPVARAPDYDVEKPLVDISQARQRAITGVTNVSENKTYYVRLTHASAWSTYDADGERKSPDVHVTLDHVNLDEGWNVSIRPKNGKDSVEENPYSDNLTLSNFVQKNGRNEAWVDQEIEVVVQPPRAENGTALAGERDSFSLRATVPGTGRSSTLEITTIIGEFANVSVQADAGTLLAHPGAPGAVLLYVNNTGSFGTTVTLNATMDSATTPNAAAWQVEPASQTFPLSAFKNRTIALLVTPPQGAASGEVTVTVSYKRNDLEVPVEVPLTLPVQVVPRGSLQLVGGETTSVIPPNGFANFTMTLQNNGGLPVDFRLAGTTLPNWTQTLSPTSGSLSPGESRTVVYVLKAPPDVVNDTRFSSLVRVVEVGNDANFDVLPVSVNILGGKAIPSLSAPKLQKTVDRGGEQRFEVNVKNVGSAAGKIDFTLRTGDPGWSAFVQTLRGDTVTSLTLAPNELETVHVVVRAPGSVPEATTVAVELLAESGGQSARANLQATIHDYGLRLELVPARVDAVAGMPVDFTLRVRNVGNDNDTLNVSANLADLPEWRVELSAERVRLEPGQGTDIHAVVRTPSEPLPTPRAYTLKFFGASVDGLAVNVSKNETITAVVNVLNYRQIDVDRDDVLELAVDHNKDASDGFERFYEISGDGVQSVVTATSQPGKLAGTKTSFFLDVPRDRPYDGIADVWFEPESVYAYRIQHAPDLNGDATPDYLLDTNRDGKVDKAFDSASGEFWSVVEVKAYGDDAVQFLVDIVPDGRPDRFYDPAGNGGKGLVTRTQRVAGDENLLGLDTDNDGQVDKHYDVKGETVLDARVSNFSDFFLKYWYFFVAFLVLALVTVTLVVRRARKD